MLLRKLVYFPVFVCQLFIGISIFLLKMVFAQLGITSTLVISVGFFLWLASSLGLQWLSTTPYAKSIPPALQTAKIQRQLVRAHWQEQLQQQPNHRDILLELAYLSCADGDLESCQEYWDQANRLDPNHPKVTAFKTEFLPEPTPTPIVP